MSFLKDLETTGDGGCELLDGLCGPMPPGLIGMFFSLEIDKSTGSGNFADLVSRKHASSSAGYGREACRHPCRVDRWNYRGRNPYLFV